MSFTDDDLIAEARAARRTAYAPYSGFPVGCALLVDSQVHRGANIENASYGLTVCAERVACVNAAMHGVRDIEVLAVATGSSPPAAPCGMCLQTLREFCTDPRRLRIILVNDHGERRDFTLADLIPHAFVKAQLDS